MYIYVFIPKITQNIVFMLRAWQFNTSLQQFIIDACKVYKVLYSVCSKQLKQVQQQSILDSLNK